MSETLDFIGLILPIIILFAFLDQIGKISKQYKQSVTENKKIMEQLVYLEEEIKEIKHFLGKE